MEDDPDTAGTNKTDNAFTAALASLPDGFSTGHFQKVRYGVTITRSADARRISLFARELGGNDVVSFNLYRLKSGADGLKPCEMSSAKVVEFVKGYLVGELSDEMNCSKAGREALRRL